MIRAVARALSILEVFTPERSSLSLLEIGNRTNLSKATAFRLVNCLEQAGYLVRLENQQYCLSLKLVGLGGVVRSTLSIRDLARPIMAELVKTTGETITLNTVLGDERLCIEVFDTPAPLMTIVKQGERAPLIRGATGKGLLAYMDKSRIDALAKDMSASDREQLHKQLARFRLQGYAITKDERVKGVSAVSVPIHDVEQLARYTLSVTGPSVRIDPNQDKLIATMLAAGEKLSAQLGGSTDKTKTAVFKPALPKPAAAASRKAVAGRKKLAKA